MEKALERAKSRIMSIQGIVGVTELNSEQCESVARLEEKAMENILGGMGRGKNEGVKESLSREVILVLFANTHFDIPKDARMMELISKGEVVGVTTTDLNKIEEFKKDKRYIVLSNFLAIKRDAEIGPDAFAKGDTYFVFHGIQIEQFSRIPEMKDHVVSFPSPPVFDFLKGQFKETIDLNDPQLAGILVGFNFQDDEHPFLISCGILKREITKLVDCGSLHFEPYFLDAGLHVDYDKLERELTQAIEKCSRNKSRGIVIVYGDLCHPNMVHIIGKYGKVVKVEALNCIDCLLGGHEKLLEIDPNHSYFYLSPGWMPSNLKMDPRFNRLFDLNSQELKKQFSKLKGIIVFDSLGNLSEFEDEICEFSNHTGLPVFDKRAVGIDGLKGVILEALKKLKDVFKT